MCANRAVKRVGVRWVHNGQNVLSRFEPGADPNADSRHVGEQRVYLHKVTRTEGVTDKIQGLGAAVAGLPTQGNYGTKRAKIKNRIRDKRQSTKTRELELWRSNDFKLGELAETIP